MPSLSRLQPAFRQQLTAFLSRVSGSGIRYRVTSTYRTRAEQTRLWRLWQSGRSRYPAAAPGRSAHEYGVAADVVFGARGQVESPLEAVVSMAREAGLVWGGAADPVHFVSADWFARGGEAPEEVRLPCEEWTRWAQQTMEVLRSQYHYSRQEAEDWVSAYLARRYPEVARDCFSVLQGAAPGAPSGQSMAEVCSRAVASGIVPRWLVPFCRS